MRINQRIQEPHRALALAHQLIIQQPHNRRPYRRTRRRSTDVRQRSIRNDLNTDA